MRIFCNETATYDILTLSRPLFCILLINYVNNEQLCKMGFGTPAVILALSWPLTDLLILIMTAKLHKTLPYLAYCVFQFYILYEDCAAFPECPAILV